MGGAPDRYFRAFAAKTGELVWAFRTNAAVTGVPITYGRIGVQYLAVQAGWGAKAEQLQATATNAPKSCRCWLRSTGGPAGVTPPGSG
jgi:alcohol dehydrogenase (cytochrome c)